MFRWRCGTTGRDVFSRKKPHGADLAVNPRLELQLIDPTAFDCLALLVHRGAVYRSTGVCVCVCASQLDAPALQTLAPYQLRARQVT